MAQNNDLAKVRATDLVMRPDFYNGIAQVLEQARGKAYRAVSSDMVYAYWEIGRRIVEEQ